MRLIIIPLMLLFLVSFTSVYGITQYSGDDFTHDGISYSIFHKFGDERILLIADGTSFIIGLDDCIEKGVKEYCFTGLDDNINGSKVKYFEGEALAELKLGINDISPDLIVSKSADRTTLKVGNTTKVTVTIKNNGKRHVDSFSYYETYPKELRITQAHPDDNSFSAIGSLAPGQSRTFEYTLIAKDHIEYDSKGDVSYFYAGEEFKVESSKITFKVEAPYVITATIDKEKVDLGDVISYEVSISPINKDIIVESLSISFPGFTWNVTDDNLTLSGKKLLWEGLINDNSSISFKNKLRAIKPQVHKLLLKVNMNIEGSPYTFTSEKEVQVLVKSPDFDLVITPEVASGGSQIKITSSVQNNDNVKLDILDASLVKFEDSVKISKKLLKQNEKVNVFEEIAFAPDIALNKTYYIKFSGKYRLEGLLEKEFEVTKTVRVHPMISSIRINVEVPEKVTAGDTFEVKVVAKNLVQKEGFVKVSDTLSYPLVVTGNRNASIKIEGESEAEAYTYNVTVPEDFNKNEIIITSTLKDAHDLTAVKTTVVNIEKPVEEVVVEVKPEPKPVEKKPENTGFFSRLVNGVKGFWRWVLEG